MKILVVEDETKVASFIKKGLEESQYEADIAYDSVFAEKLARQYKYDLFILDIIIPGTGGLELCKKLKMSFPGIPVLMLTALGTTEDKLAGFEAGTSDYLVKPFEFRELLARVKVLLKSSDQPRETANKLIWNLILTGRQYEEEIH
jgi:DNA-binding response OmpR family regulator